MPAEYVLPHFDNTLGALLVGFAISATAFGMLTIQVFTYYRRFPQDKAAYKALAALIWSFSFVDQSFVGYAVYFYTITNYLNPVPLVTGKPQWSLILQMTLGAVVGAIVKACFTLRVWRFSYRNWWLTGILFLMIIAQLGTAIAFTVKCFELPSYSHLFAVKVHESTVICFSSSPFVVFGNCFLGHGSRRGYEHSCRIVFLPSENALKPSNCGLHDCYVNNIRSEYRSSYQHYQPVDSYSVQHHAWKLRVCMHVFCSEQTVCDIIPGCTEHSKNHTRSWHRP